MTCSSSCCFVILADPQCRREDEQALFQARGRPLEADLGQGRLGAKGERRALREAAQGYGHRAPGHVSVLKSKGYFNMSLLWYRDICPHSTFMNIIQYFRTTLSSSVPSCSFSFACTAVSHAQSLSSFFVSAPVDST